MTPGDAATALSAPEGSVDPVTFFDYLFRMTPEQRDSLCNRIDGQESVDYARTRVVNLLREHATVTRRGAELSYNLSCISISSGEDPNVYLWFHMSDMGEWMTRDFVEHNHKWLYTFFPLGCFVRLSQPGAGITMSQHLRKMTTQGLRTRWTDFTRSGGPEANTKYHTIYQENRLAGEHGIGKIPIPSWYIMVYQARVEISRLLSIVQ
ncbi:uncharacterized protein MKK02DRAFT_32081 [Dioszegia hungarica]|uniref:Uncharacterized protein n=1 Tax=Dioszegia hungarica TaxID=4972 RepID=A0AA38HDF8_9TREE|nr:uncharacterized protein MKK02DRAFT_32081 [Dioszegia hungarica]KAI9638695.1 hypothetical protein MKK02DRAFT_32081 [Dioszegia hungarica]